MAKGLIRRCQPSRADSSASLWIEPRNTLTKSTSPESFVADTTETYFPFFPLPPSNDDISSEASKWRSPRHCVSWSVLTPRQTDSLSVQLRNLITSAGGSPRISAVHLLAIFKLHPSFYSCLFSLPATSHIFCFWTRRWLRAATHLPPTALSRFSACFEWMFFLPLLMLVLFCQTAQTFGPFLRLPEVVLGTIEGGDRCHAWICVQIFIHLWHTDLMSQRTFWFVSKEPFFSDENKYAFKVKNAFCLIWHTVAIHLKCWTFKSEAGL